MKKREEGLKCDFFLVSQKKIEKKQTRVVFGLKREGAERGRSFFFPLVRKEVPRVFPCGFLLYVSYKSSKVVIPFCNHSFFPFVH